MDAALDELVSTRRSLHAVAELVLAGPQLTESDSIELRVTPGGFGTVTAPALFVRDGRLVTADREVVVDGRTAADVAADCGVSATSLAHVYDGGPKVAPDEVLTVDEGAAATLAGAFALGDAALRAFAPDQRPVLWPEHFDVGITVGRVNYGVSPGDEHRPAPYAYVGPWDVPAGDFWNEPFGAARDLDAFGDAEQLAAWFREGQRRAGG